VSVPTAWSGREPGTNVTPRVAGIGAALILCLSLLASCTGVATARRDLATASAVPRLSDGRSLTPHRPVMREAVLGVQPNWYRIDHIRAYVQRLGGGSSWIPVVWCKVERDPASWDWGALDRIVDEARSLDLTLQLKIRVGACWLTQQPPSFHTGFVTESEMPSDIGAYAAFVRAVVSRYSLLGVHSYAVENEPNTRYQWGGSLAQLLRLTEVAAATIRDADHRARVVDWGLSTGVYGDAVAQRLLLAGKDSDAVAEYDHYYRTAKRPVAITSVDHLRATLASGQDRRNLVYLRADERLLARHVFDVRQLHFYESTTILPSVIGYLRATTAPGIPIEAWELGRHVGPAALNLRAEVVKSVCLLLAAGIREIDWLPLAAPPSGNEPNFALLNPGGATRLAGQTYRRLALLVTRASAFRPLTLPGASGLVVTRKARTTLVIWSDVSPGLRLRLPDGSQVRPLAGAEKFDGGFLDVGSEPVLVSIDRPLPAVRQALIHGH
jgi:hypothetical protein